MCILWQLVVIVGNSKRIHKAMNALNGFNLREKVCMYVFVNAKKKETYIYLSHRTVLVQTNTFSHLGLRRLW